MIVDGPWHETCLFVWILKLKKSSCLTYIEPVNIPYHDSMDSIRMGNMIRERAVAVASSGCGNMGRLLSPHKKVLGALLLQHLSSQEESSELFVIIIVVVVLFSHAVAFVIFKVLFVIPAHILEFVNRLHLSAVHVRQGLCKANNRYGQTQSAAHNADTPMGRLQVKGEYGQTD
jgi:hypothetical protein